MECAKQIAAAAEAQCRAEYQAKTLAWIQKIKDFVNEEQCDFPCDCENEGHCWLEEPQGLSKCLWFKEILQSLKATILSGITKDPLAFSPDYKFTFQEVVVILREYMQSAKPVTYADKIALIEGLGVPVDEFKMIEHYPTVTNLTEIPLREYLKEKK